MKNRASVFFLLLLTSPTSEERRKKTKKTLSPFGFRLQLARSLLHPPLCRRGLALQLRLCALRQIGRGALDLLLRSGDGRGCAVRCVVDAPGGVSRCRGDGVRRLVCRGGELRRGLAVLREREREREKRRGREREEKRKRERGEKRNGKKRSVGRGGVDLTRKAMAIGSTSPKSRSGTLMGRFLSQRRTIISSMYPWL